MNEFLKNWYDDCIVSYCCSSMHVGGLLVTLKPGGLVIGHFFIQYLFKTHTG